MSRPFSETIALITGTGSGEGIDRDLLADATIYKDVAVTFGSECGRVVQYTEGS